MQNHMCRQSSISFIGIDTATPNHEPLCAKYTKTFAYHTVKDRLPVILTKIVDQLSRDKEEIIKKYPTGVEEDIKSIIGKISKLKNEVQTNKPLLELMSSSSDIDKWNKYLFIQQETPCWYQAPWLYVENYMYRRLYEMFENSEYLQNFDYFQKQKESAFNNTLSSLKMLARDVLNYINGSTDTNVISNNCVKMLKLDLWSNRCDLSLSCGEDVDKNEDDISHLDCNLIVDQSKLVSDLLMKSADTVIDFVHDNAGYELFTDLCLADYLCSVMKIKEIRFHVKKMPWYVSDVTEQDFNWVIEQTEINNMKQLSDRWKKYLENKTWTLHDNDYWTLPYDYNDMLSYDPTLYKQLSESSLVLFKGDLNYRKLLGDINWPYTSEFKQCLRSFLPTNVVTLRTVKADLICGLKPGQAEVLFEKDLNWMVTGDYGVIQLATV